MTQSAPCVKCLFLRSCISWLYAHAMLKQRDSYTDPPLTSHSNEWLNLPHVLNGTQRRPLMSPSKSLMSAISSKSELSGFFLAIFSEMSRWNELSGRSFQGRGGGNFVNYQLPYVCYSDQFFVWFGIGVQKFSRIITSIYCFVSIEFVISGQQMIVCDVSSQFIWLEHTIIHTWHISINVSLSNKGFDKSCQW